MAAARLGQQTLFDTQYRHSGATSLQPGNRPYGKGHLVKKWMHSAV
ncbi:hypothetical protein ACNKHM_12370 [Shigella sonnei]